MNIIVKQCQSTGGICMNAVHGNADFCWGHLASHKVIKQEKTIATLEAERTELQRKVGDAEWAFVRITHKGITETWRQLREGHLKHDRFTACEATASKEGKG